MASRFLDVGVALAALVSVVLLGVMLAAPALPAATAGPASLASSTAEPSSTPSADLPPLGLFVLRGQSPFGPCLGLELTPPSYPIGENAAAGVATVSWWERGMTGCDSRTGDVGQVEAGVERLARENAPDETVGYAVRFELPLADGAHQGVELTILAARSTQALLQVTDAGGSGQGLVFDRVEAIDPPLDPLPSPTPVAAFQPDGLYLLRGPFDSDGPCLVLELGDESYPADPNATGTASIRWWERAVADPGNPAECLTRAGDVHETPASVVAARGADGLFIAYAVSFAVPVPASDGAVQEVEIHIAPAESSVDQLWAAVLSPQDVAPLVLDRVDSIDPPLGP